MNNSMLTPQRNSFCPKKKLRRLSSGREHRNTTQQLSIPPQLHVSPKGKNNNKVQLTVPRIIIDTAEDEKNLENKPISRSKGLSFSRPGLHCNAKLLHPSFAVCSAVSANDPVALKNIVLSGTVNIDQLGTNGATALHEASYDGKIACVDILLQCGAEVNIRDREGWTPLHAAVCGRSRECAKELVQHGANTKAKSNDGLTPLAIARQQKDKAMITMLTSFRQAAKETLSVFANV